MTIIYALINPITDCPFYVGSTTRTLQERLKEHISISVREDLRGKMKLKQNVINSLLEKGVQPIIKRILLVNDDKAGQAEKQVYEHYVGLGFILLQEKKQLLCFEKSKTETEKTIIEVSASGRLSLDSKDIEIVKLLAMGYTMKQMVSVVFLSSRTIETRIGKIREKFGATTLSHLMAILFKTELLF